MCSTNSEFYRSRLHGKKVLVTGASSGIGRETAIEMAREGAEVVLNYYKNAEGADSAAREINGWGGKAHIVRADLGDVSEARRLAEQAIQMMNGIDILVNNAGISKTYRFFDVTQDEFDELYNVNIRGMFFCSQVAAAYMAENGGGSIVNVSSVHGMASLPGYSVYASTKVAIIQFSRQLAVELARYRIRINCVVPGCILVPRNFEDNLDLDAEEIAKTIPFKTVGTTQDIAKTIIFLASDDAKYITGNVTVVDGGLLAKLAFQTPESVE